MDSIHARLLWNTLKRHRITGHPSSPPGLPVPRPAPAAVSEPAVLLSLSLPVLQRTVAVSVVGKPVPPALTVSHI